MLKASARKELKDVEERLKQRQHEMKGLEKEYKRLRGPQEQLWEAEDKL